MMISNSWSFLQLFLLTVALYSLRLVCVGDWRGSIDEGDEMMLKPRSLYPMTAVY